MRQQKILFKQLLDYGNEIKTNGISYQHGVFMCTYSCSKPLVGLKLSLGLNINDAYIKISCKGCMGEKKNREIFTHCPMKK